MSDETAFETLVGDEETAEKMREDLEAVLEADNQDEDFQGLQVGFNVYVEEIPKIIEALDDMMSDG